jgi:hypothetical protein
VSPVRHELGFYIPEDDILHSHRRENLKSNLGSVYISRILQWKTRSNLLVIIVSTSNVYTEFIPKYITYQSKQTQWLLVSERTIPTERPPLVDEI